MNTRPLSPEHIERLEKSLQRHLVQLRKDLADEERDVVDLHYRMAGNLRVLLCDSQCPILLEYAKHRGMDLRVWGPKPPGFTGPPDKATVWELHALVATTEPTDGAYEMLIEDYLNTPIGAATRLDDTDGRPLETIWYTPRDIIKWVTNKEGVAHLQLTPFAKLEAVRAGITISGSIELVDAGGVRLRFGAAHDFVTRSAILQIAQWTVRNLERLLAAERP